MIYFLYTLLSVALDLDANFHVFWSCRVVNTGYEIQLLFQDSIRQPLHFSTINFGWRNNAKKPCRRDDYFAPFVRVLTHFCSVLFLR